MLNWSNIHVYVAFIYYRNKSENCAFGARIYISCHPLSVKLAAGLCWEQLGSWAGVRNSLSPRLLLRKLTSGRDVSGNHRLQKAYKNTKICIYWGWGKSLLTLVTPCGVFEFREITYHVETIIVEIEYPVYGSVGSCRRDLDLVVEIGCQALRAIRLLVKYEYRVYH